MSFDTGQLAWLLLQTVNRTQANGSTVRLVVLREPAVLDELGMGLTDDELLSAEEYLQEHGYLALDEIGLARSAYTITPAGLRWLEGGFPGQRNRLRELAERPGEEAAFESAVRAELEEERRRMEGLERELDGFQTASERHPWWRRIFGG